MEIRKFKDFLFKRWQTISTQADGTDTLVRKSFKIKGLIYHLIARFNNKGEYINGFLADERGTGLVIGKGFSIDSFISLCDSTIKAL